MERRSLLLSFSLALCMAVNAHPTIFSGSSTAIPDQYIVVFKQNAAQQLRDQHVANVKSMISSHPNTQMLAEYNFGTFRGYAAKINSQILQQISQDHAGIVDWIEGDQTMHTTSCITETGATWGIDRLDGTNPKLDGTFTYDSNSGSNVDAYVIDTGINIHHVDFQTTSASGTVSRAYWMDGSSANDDCNGHGTHVAGTIGSNTYGVAKGVTLYAMKVLDCSGSGSISGIITGIQQVSNFSATRTGRRAVANMSLGGSASSSLDSAVNTAINNFHIAFSIAAGNSNADACNSSPARVAAAVTVGATNNQDTRSSFSNWGSCVDIFAPGETITSTWIGSSNTATNTISGTSMATPHVTGILATLLEQHPTDTVSQVTSRLTNSALKGVIDLGCRTRLSLCARRTVNALAHLTCSA